MLTLKNVVRPFAFILITAVIALLALRLVPKAQAWPTSTVDYDYYQ